MSLDEITPVAQDYLKAIWSATEWGDAPLSTNSLAARMGTTAPNVTETVKRLAAQGLVEYQPYKPVTLTGKGREHAIAMVRRHRLLESFLAATLGYSWDEVHAEAERLEHAASDELIERIDQMLGRPTRDPHGDPIPTPEGQRAQPAHAVRLDVAEPGFYRVLRISDADPQRLVRFQQAGLVPGTVVEVTEAGHSRLRVVAVGPVELIETDAAAIWLVPSATRG
ncbi:metal-dependent transcriptional regulator [Micrococcus luteus]|uniref:Manganese transport regulator n=1 Tax=Micrococcus luteus TaxID=1270 RepID=A0AAP3EY14_MICLU|nr:MULTISPECIES: metal-dependent transcriptional regulator [Micrococcales]MCJ2193750.1 metal-dependent transcriptional regulator [Kaistella montana]MBN6767597.1 metal-dependent transcriptional regulator [Micrococcus luteus]MBN6827318.1 metal-dependent transcriptional regulator [Micrococcus luteus]MBN6846680.1 metal-dependent transcriptional regulator [Micrococcus luteus]MBN6862783.1 metal-dependent transcriptional regulator [Micrococcus luteus]